MENSISKSIDWTFVVTNVTCQPSPISPSRSPGTPRDRERTDDPMKTTNVLNDLRARIESGYPLIFLNSAEEDRWERELAEVAMELERGLVTWTITRGLQPPASDQFNEPPSARLLLDQLSLYPDEHLFLVKDFHPFLSDPYIVRSIRDVLPQLIKQRKTLLFFGPVSAVPLELEKESIKIKLPMPDYDDLREEFDRVWSDLQTSDASTLQLSTDDEDRLIKSVMGLTAQEACQAWRRALHSCRELNDDLFATLISEKRSLATASDILEFYDLEDGASDIGGLDQLKDWISKRAEAYSPRAREQNVPLPKGVLLLGVQGCGKSLTARATARILSFPLIRLDIAAVLGAQRGESERNLRNVLNLVESIAPAVLWLDEIEKGFAGVEDDGRAGADNTMVRLLGTFLTWMMELDLPIFVVATTNSIERLPPEMLRRGRFDELFFVDLPNFEERRNILEIHLRKRGWKTEQLDIDDIARRSEGFSGSELEQIVVSALIEAFGDHRVLAQGDLERAWRATVPLSITMEDKIFALRNWAQDRCRRATSDSRVTAMLEAEHRNDLARSAKPDPAASTAPPWMQLASAGQLKAAIVEFVRAKGEVLFPEIVDVMRPYMEVAGDQGLALRTNPNTVLWAGLSQALSELLTELTASKRIYIHPTELDRYKSIQQGIRLPVLKEPTDDRIPRAAWLPASVRTAPHPVHGTRLSRIGRMRLAPS